MARWPDSVCSTVMRQSPVLFVPEFTSFKVGGPSLARSGGAIPSTGCVVPQPFAAGGNQPYLDFWAITSDPWYPRYKTPISSSCHL
jgi:hypothetical protein